MREAAARATVRGAAAKATVGRWWGDGGKDFGMAILTEQSITSICPCTNVGGLVSVSSLTLSNLARRSMSVSAGGAGLEDIDPDLDAARTELIRSDQERTPVELAVGVHAASAAAMQKQHMADDVNGAARRKYLGITDDVSAKLTPFEQYVVVDML